MVDHVEKNHGSLKITLYGVVENHAETSFLFLFLLSSLPKHTIKFDSIQDQIFNVRLYIIINKYFKKKVH